MENQKKIRLSKSVIYSLSKQKTILLVKFVGIIKDLKCMECIWNLAKKSDKITGVLRLFPPKMYQLCKSSSILLRILNSFLQTTSIKIKFFLFSFQVLPEVLEYITAEYLYSFMQILEKGNIQVFFSTSYQINFQILVNNAIKCHS